MRIPLIDNLARQLARLTKGKQRVEITILETESEANGGPTTGAKRQAMLERCKGEYVCWIDDDDDVADDYLTQIMRRLAWRDSSTVKLGCIGLMGRMFTPDGKPTARLIHSMGSGPEQYARDGVCYRSPNHLNPILRDVAIRAGFPDVTVGEDQEYGKRCYPMLKLLRELFIDKELYYYKRR